MPKSGFYASKMPRLWLINIFSLDFTEQKAAKEAKKKKEKEDAENEEKRQKKQVERLHNLISDRDPTVGQTSNYRFLKSLLYEHKSERKWIRARDTSCCRSIKIGLK